MIVLLVLGAVVIFKLLFRRKEHSPLRAHAIRSGRRVGSGHALSFQLGVSRGLRCAGPNWRHSSRLR